MIQTKSNPKVVVIGGGTGSSVVLSGLKRYPIDLTAIISVADSGGSTGRLRDEFGFQAVGDLRQALAALAKDGDQTWIRDLLLYRFNKGDGLEGHNLGNLILTALQDMTGSTPKASEIASHIFRLKGHIYPSTTKKVELVIQYSDGSIVIGEHRLNPQELGGKKIKKIMLSPQASIYPKAKTSLQEANLIIVGPGDLYASILPNLAVKGMKPTLKSSPARIVFVLNLMTVYTQTHNMTAADHLLAVEKAIGRPVDSIIVNHQPIPSNITKAYSRQHEYPVIDDLGPDPRVRRESLVTQTKIFHQIETDAVQRSFLRHNPNILAKTIISLC